MAKSDVTGYRVSIMNIRSFLEANAFAIESIGLILALVGWLWLLIRFHRMRRSAWSWRRIFAPIGMLLLGVAIAVLPPLCVNLIPPDLGPHEKMVDGERHLTLTGWDRKDYAILGSKHDTVVLQMANPDVTDATLAHLRGMNELRELDLNNTAITDAGLATINELPKLTSLRLGKTRITDAGFRSALMGKESLVRLSLQGTAVAKETGQAWKAAKADRRLQQ